MEQMDSTGPSVSLATRDSRRGRVSRALREGKSRVEVAIAFPRSIWKGFRSKPTRQEKASSDFPPVPSEESRRGFVVVPGNASDPLTELPAYPYTDSQSALADYFARLAAEADDESAEHEARARTPPATVRTPTAPDSTRLEVPPADDTGGSHTFERFEWNRAGSALFAPGIDDLPQYQLASNAEAGSSIAAAVNPESTKAEVSSASIRPAEKDKEQMTQPDVVAGMGLPIENEALLRDGKDVNSSLP